VAPEQILDRKQHRRHDGGHDAGRDLPEIELVQLQKLAEQDGVFVACATLLGLDAPVGEQLVAVVHAEDGVGIADVNDQEHGWASYIQSLPKRAPSRAPQIAATTSASWPSAATSSSALRGSTSGSSATASACTPPSSASPWLGCALANFAPR